MNFQTKALFITLLILFMFGACTQINTYNAADDLTVHHPQKVFQVINILTVSLTLLCITIYFGYNTFKMRQDTVK